MIPAVPVTVGVTAEGSACLGSANIRQRRAASQSMSFSQPQSCRCGDASGGSVDAISAATTKDNALN